ncbi:MAG: hypothetical protein EPN85_10865 [Bacteroidetes bacterium]|nr:MAG: hypothetical protein EPN85_10865 [Bacteroidota bacterium]
MNKFIKISAISFSSVICLAALIIIGCSKDRIEQLTAYSPVNTYLDTKKQQEQEFIIDSSGSGPIVGNQGTQIWIGKQCLQFPNGDSVSWPFTVKLVELYTPKDMIYYQQPTVASVGILKTDGEIRLRAFKNGTELMLKPDPCLAAIAMPNPAPQAGMRVFYGFGTAPSDDWTDDPVAFGITTSLSPNFITTASSYTASIARLGWINCGQNAGTTPTSTLTFTSQTDDLTNVGIFIYFTATKTVMQTYNMSSKAIPNGSSVRIVAIGIDAGGNLFSWDQTKTVSSNEAIDITMAATTDAALTALLDGL